MTDTTQGQLSHGSQGQLSHGSQAPLSHGSQGQPNIRSGRSQRSTRADQEGDINDDRAADSVHSNPNSDSQSLGNLNPEVF